jgi:hypothetical protein
MTYDSIEEAIKFLVKASPTSKRWTKFANKSGFKNKVEVTVTNKNRDDLEHDFGQSLARSESNHSNNEMFKSSSNENIIYFNYFSSSWAIITHG